MARRKTRSAAQRRATAKLVALNRARRGGSSHRRKARRRNPISTIMSRAKMRRPARRVSNPLDAHRRRRRRHNPILGGLTTRGIMSQVKDALIGAGGAVAVDAIYSRLNPMLPASLQRSPGMVGAGDAVKALLTIAAGKLLARPTRGMSVKMAQGALTVQAHGIVSSMLPAGFLGFYSPARIVQGTQRVGPMRNAIGMQGLRAYDPPLPRTAQQGPLLNAYLRAGATPLLSGNTSNAREREGVTNYR